ncbi:M24 family metallopeptidase [Halomarina litorea]|uniref:M24 family metallopeptidase n=1 Tax=Halomarina litorea TaxID=2961595 RepID=UPI0020C53F52|nr:M24 family metallopeptidase [Halomarina sp. BCD28]
MHPEKRARLDEFLDEEDVEAVWFARSASFAWLTGGDNVVDRAGDVGVAAVGYDGDGLEVVTDDIEAPRLRAEELPDDVPVEAYEWFGATLGEAVAERSARPAAVDFDVPGSSFEDLDASPLRQPLTDDDCEAYRALGRETAEAVEAVCRECSPEDTEREVAADLRERLARAGIDSPVALVGGEERAPTYRHYTPTDTEIGGYALASVTARRGGLYASCTRTVAFDPPEWLEERHDAASAVEVSALAATRAVGFEGSPEAAKEAKGGTAGDVFAALQSAYEAVGWPDEWRRHHQGGAAGFAGREWIATPGGKAPVVLPMGYAWNPTVEGAKSEDTVLVTGEGYEVLTATDGGDWPTQSVDAVGELDDGTDLELALDRPAVLEREG